MRPPLRILGLSCAAAVAWAVMAMAAPTAGAVSGPLALLLTTEAVALPQGPQMRVYRRYRTHPVAAARKSAPQAFNAVRRSKPVPAPRRHHTTPVR